MPKLGSLRDRVLREFVVREAELEQKKTEMLAIIALQSFGTSDAAAGREHSERVNRVWQEYTNLAFGMPYDKHKDVDKELLNFYQAKVKNAKATLRKTGGRISVEGINDIFGK